MKKYLKIATVIVSSVLIGLGLGIVGLLIIEQLGLVVIKIHNG
jgi:hypothetical protein